MNTQPTDHRAEAEDATNRVASRADARDAQTVALLAIGHWLGANHDVLREIADTLRELSVEDAPIVEDDSTVEMVRPDFGVGGPVLSQRHAPFGSGPIPPIGYDRAEALLRDDR